MGSKQKEDHVKCCRHSYELSCLANVVTQTWVFEIHLYGEMVLSGMEGEKCFSVTQHKAAIKSQ